MENVTYKRGIIRDVDGWGVRISITSRKFISVSSQPLKQTEASLMFILQNPSPPKEHGSHNLDPHRLYSKFITSPSNSEQEKHMIYHNISKIIHAHIEKGENLPFFQILIFKFFFESFSNKSPVSNTQVSSDIEKRQHLGNGAKNLLS